MIYKYLGNTTEKISAIGQGTIGAGAAEKATSEKIELKKRVILSGIEQGINYLDTGEDYEGGHAETILGQIIGKIRDKVFISSKFKPENNGFEKVIKAAEKSLKRIKTDYIDLYQMQWPNINVPLSETLDAMMTLVRQGKVRYVGVCNLTCSQLEIAKKHCGDKLVSIQTEYNMLNRSIESDILPFCKSNGMTLIAYSPLCRARLQFYGDQKDLLASLSKKYSASIAQIILNWIVSHESIVALTQTMNLDHVKENADATKILLEQKDAEEMSRRLIREPVFVSTEKIRILNQDADETHQIYLTLEDALSNRLNINPSPENIADELRQGGMLKPVELKATNDRTGRYAYDLTHGRMRYWAWVIAYGRDESIPAYILN
jgi:diketogulonate reductase-like aldo/keto reductase